MRACQKWRPFCFVDNAPSAFFWYNDLMFLEKLSQNIMSFRQNIILGIFLLLIVISSFFSGEWNNWLVAVILILAFPLVFYTLLLRRGQNPEPDKRINLKSPFFYFLIFLLVGAVTSIFSVMKYNSIHYLVLLIAYGVIFWSASTVFRNFSKVKIVAWAIFFIGLLAALISIFLFLKDSPERTEGLLRNANALGGYFLFAVPLGIVLALEARQKKHKIFLGLGTGLILLAFFLTFSLTAWISFLIPLAVIVLYFRKRLFTRKNISVFLVLFLALLIAAVAVRYSSTRDFGKALNLQETISSFHLNYSFVQRWNFLQSALDIFIKYPLVGTGLATYQQVYPSHAFSILEQPRYAHNYYLQTAAETGVIGFVFFMGFIVSLLAVIYRAVKKFLPDDHKRPYLLGLALGLVGSCLHSLFDFGWQFPAVFILFWISAGIFMSQSDAARANSDLTLRPAARPLVKIGIQALVVIGLLLLGRGVTLAVSQSYYDRAELEKIDGNLDAALPLYSLSVKLDPAPDKLRTYAFSAFQQGAINKNERQELYSQAEAVFQNISKYNRGDYFSHHQAGKMYFMRKEFDKAQAEYLRAIELDPIFHPDFYYDLAFLYYSQNKYNEAIIILLSVIDRYENISVSSNPYLLNQLAWHNLLIGRAYLDKGDKEKARQYWQESLRLEPDFKIAQDELNKLGQ